MNRFLSFVVAVSLVITFSSTGLVAQADTPPPTSLAALGDSITRAYNTGPAAYQDYPAGSWATGTIASSHATRLSLTGTAVFNDALSGSKMSDLPRQATLAAGQGVGYVTILMGGNDICTRTEGDMTSPAAFEADFRSALTTLKGTGLAEAPRVFVASIPNVRNLLEVLKNNGSARFIWAIFGICQSMLARPTSTATADVQRRARVAAENVALNDALRRVCTSADFNSFCRYDGGAVYGTAFAAADVSTRDYFHPSTSGQKKLACATWPVSWWPTLVTPPSGCP